MDRPLRSRLEPLLAVPTPAATALMAMLSIAVVGCFGPNLAHAQLSALTNRGTGQQANKNDPDLSSKPVAGTV